MDSEYFLNLISKSIRSPFVLEGSDTCIFLGVMSIGHDMIVHSQFLNIILKRTEDSNWGVFVLIFMLMFVVKKLQILESTWMW